jgi:putative oligomerization/nucleic acid binding protein
MKALIVCCTALLAGCAASPPIQPADTSKSAFDGAVYKGTTLNVAQGAPGSERYRVFSQASTGFVSMASVRDDAEQRAKDFCDRKGKVLESLTETTTTPPYILGNFPRIEIVFDCVQRPVTTQAAADDPKYTKLTNLKKLLDSGTITQAEFDREKAKILGQP